MVKLTNQIFEDDELTIAYLRHYIFITRSIHRAKYELDQLRYEQQTIHEYVMASPQFRQAMQPIVRTYRRRARQSGLHPYTRQPLNLNEPCSPQMSQSFDSFPTVNQQPLVEIDSAAQRRSTGIRQLPHRRRQRR